MNRRRRDLILMIAVLMASATTLQEATRGIMTQSMAPNVLIAAALALGLRVLVRTFEVVDHRS